MYTLFAYPNSYAMTAHSVLEESGAAYEVNWVQIFTNQLDPEFKRISPHGRVPALRDKDITIFETGAIAYYIAECHPDIDLIIKEGEPERALFLQWFHYLASTLQPDVMIQFHPEIYFPNNDQLQTQFRDMSLTRLAGVLDIIENNLSRGLYFCGSRRTIIDYLFVMQAVWPEIFPHKITDYPNISDLVERLLSRPAVKRVYDLHMEKRKPPISAS